MKLETKESLIAIQYFLVVLLTIALLLSFYLPNAILIALLWVLATVVSTKKIKAGKKKAAAVLVLVLIGLYLWFPKNNASCGMLSGDAAFCRTVTCRGLPAKGTNVSFCLGQTSLVGR